MIWSLWPQNMEWTAKYTWTHLFTIFYLQCRFLRFFCNKLHHDKINSLFFLMKLLWHWNRDINIIYVSDLSKKYGLYFQLSIFCNLKRRTQKYFTRTQLKLHNCQWVYLSHFLKGLVIWVISLSFFSLSLTWLNYLKIPKHYSKEFDYDSQAKI